VAATGSTPSRATSTRTSSSACSTGPGCRGDDRAALLDRALALVARPGARRRLPARVRERVGTRLAQARLAALEERAGDHLARGDHDAAIALLAGPALDRSVPEPLVALLMRAYTASGRRAEALAVYDRARQLLWQELRIHPGQSLVDERNRARWGSGRAAAPPVAPPAARPDAPPAAAQRPSAPHELPAAPIGFVGRDRELRRLLDVLGAAGPRDRPTVVALHGPGGVGKSALAVAAARHLADRFPDGQVYIDLCGSTPGVPSLTALEAAGQALRSLGVPAADIPGPRPRRPRGCGPGSPAAGCSCCWTTPTTRRCRGP
jgi:hypothetical protein